MGGEAGLTSSPAFPLLPAVNAGNAHVQCKDRAVMNIENNDVDSKKKNRSYH